MLEALLDADGAPVSKDTLMARAWPDMVIEEGNLTVLVSTIRRQLGKDADALIVTVPRCLACSYAALDRVDDAHARSAASAS